jgi:hypothetical protein
MRLEEESASRVRLVWRPWGELPYAREVALDFDPALAECREVEVLVSGSEDPRPVRPDDTVLRGFDAPARDASAAIWMELGDAPCSLLAVVGRVPEKGDGCRLLVTKEGGQIGTVELETPRNPWWIPLVPVGAVADLAILPPAALAVSCLSGLESNLCIETGLEVLDSEY